MRNNLFQQLSAKRSIRAHMLWSTMASFILAFVSSVYLPFKFPDMPGQGIYNLLTTFLSFSVVFFFAFFLLTRRSMAYLLKLEEGLGTIAGGSLNYRIPMLRTDELGRIAANINDMAERLERQLDKERQMEQSKMELITGVSHDLRTPLTSIIGYLELLKGKAYQNESEYERFIGNTYNKANQMKVLIDDLFAYTRLTSHEATIHPQRIDLSALLRQIETEFHPLAQENGLKTDHMLPPDPFLMEVDPDLIRRAIDNLYINALKFSKKTSVIRLSLAPSGEPGMEKAIIRVENEGQPISPEQEDRLFERFYKVDDSRTSPMPSSGSGLGLAIARSIARLHGGEIVLIHLHGHYDFRMELPVRRSIRS